MDGCLYFDCWFYIKRMLLKELNMDKRSTNSHLLGAGAKEATL